MKRQNALQFLLKNIAISHLEHSYGEGVAGRVVGETHLMMARIMMMIMVVAVMVIEMMMTLTMMMTKSSPSFSLIGGWSVRQNCGFVAKST